MATRMKKAKMEDLLSRLWDLAEAGAWRETLGSELKSCLHCDACELDGHKGDCPVAETRKILQEESIL